MPIELFLNELSTPLGAVTASAASKHLRGLVNSLRELRKITRDLILNTDTPLNAVQIGAGNTIASLRNSNDCVEEGQFLKLLKDRAPLNYAIDTLNGLDPAAVEFQLRPTDPIFEGKSPTALGLASHYNGVTLSFATHELWNHPFVGLERIRLDDKSDSILSDNVQAKNVCTPSHVNVHASDILKAVTPEIRDGKDLWSRRADLFPDLLFIPRVRGQIERLLSGDRVFSSALSRLKELQAATAEWIEKGTKTPSFPFYCRPESEGRINDGLVNFTDENGTTRTFSLHADFGPAEGRLHFIILSDPKKHILVGHVDRKIGIG